MRALQIDREGSTRLVTVAPPEPAAGDVLIRVRTVGFCGSDLNTYRGLNPLVTYPRIPGHEIAGVVERVGGAVPAELFRSGIDVTVVPYTACGRCAACRRGRTNACRDNQTLGVQREGALTELVAVPWEKVLRADGLSARELALVEPLSVGFHAVDRGRVETRDTVLVIGCGAVGLGAIAGAAHRGARVIAVDVDDDKLALGRRAGASETIDTRRGSLHERVQALTDGDGADVVIEAVGLPETFVGAVAEVAFTGRVIYIGYAKAPVTFDTSQFVKKELDILGSRNATADDFRAVMDMLRSGTFPVADAVTRVVGLDDAGDALRDWSARPAAITRIHVDLA
ncbi:MAG TPA: zinc-binding alcohol dehydrogenase family protein [Gemmatimonadaceae bacterium]|jgi:2-desacetyl-2-hydroxyethyl bacteriochlorophyllide A dehydrogenase|nr:zinc-binding alcohol dehydrogenase family protein [Gemmatimonadaceae bacterium]